MRHLTQVSNSLLQQLDTILAADVDLKSHAIDFCVETQQDDKSFSKVIQPRCWAERNKLFEREGRVGNINPEGQCRSSEVNGLFAQSLRFYRQPQDR